MGTLRTSFAWLAASLTVGLVSGLPHVTLANDVGPGKEVRTIRRDLPVLAAGRLWNAPARKIEIVAVAVEGDTALAQWQSDGDARIDYLTRRLDRWWLAQEIRFTPSSTQGEYACAFRGPASDVLRDLGVPAPLVAKAKDVLPAVLAADAAATPDPTPQPSGTLVKTGCHYDFTDATRLRFSTAPQSPYRAVETYQMTITMAPNDAKGASLERFSGRAPTEAESWVSRDGNSFFFFSGTLDSPAAVHVDAGTKIDVWFPFVLDPTLHYAITIGFAEKPIGPLDGTLKDNVVHFVLPSFTLLPGKTIMGEVESTPYAHY